MCFCVEIVSCTLRMVYVHTFWWATRGNKLRFSVGSGMMAEWESLCKKNINAERSSWTKHRGEERVKYHGKDHGVCQINFSFEADIFVFHKKSPPIFLLLYTILRCISFLELPSVPVPVHEKMKHSTLLI